MSGSYPGDVESIPDDECPKCGSTAAVCPCERARRASGKVVVVRADKRPYPSTLQALEAEVIRARAKFPDSDYMLAALMEEVGELARAMLEHGYGSAQAREEALHVACVAIRILEEGDRTFRSERGVQASPRWIGD